MMKKRKWLQWGEEEGENFRFSSLILLQYLKKGNLEKTKEIIELQQKYKIIASVSNNRDSSTVTQRLFSIDIGL